MYKHTVARARVYMCICQIYGISLIGKTVVEFVCCCLFSGCFLLLGCCCFVCFVCLLFFVVLFVCLFVFFWGGGLSIFVLFVYFVHLFVVVFCSSFQSTDITYYAQRWQNLGCRSCLIDNRFLENRQAVYRRNSSAHAIVHHCTEKVNDYDFVFSPHPSPHFAFCSAHSSSFSKPRTATANEQYLHKYTNVRRLIDLFS